MLGRGKPSNLFGKRWAMSTIIFDEEWEYVRQYFSEDEKIELRLHVIGEIICPHGFCVDANELPKELKRKLFFHVPEARQRKRRA